MGQERIVWPVMTIRLSIARFLPLLAFALFNLPGLSSGQDRPLLLEDEVEDRLRAVQRSSDPAEQLRRALSAITTNRWLSSAQVKTLARGIVDEERRMEFALAAFPRTVDPENFYEVYDAFTRYSRVFRLHDAVQALRAGMPPTERPPGPPPAPTVTPAELADVIKTLKAEPFDETRSKLAKQILTARVRFTSSQVRDIVKTISFEESRLPLAKAAYDYVVDPENYYVVAQAFTFSDSKEELLRYLESHRPHRPR